MCKKTFQLSDKLRYVKTLLKILPNKFAPFAIAVNGVKLSTFKEAANSTEKA